LVAQWLKWYSSLTTKTKRWLWVALAIVLGMIIFLIGRTFSSPQQAPPAFSIPVEVSAVRTGTLVRSIKAVGTLCAYQSVVIRPEITGRVTNISYIDGRPIQKDELLLTLDDSIPKAALEAALANFTLSQAEYKRADSLVKQQALSATDRDTAFAKLQVDQAQVDQAKAHLAKMTLRAPFAGTVGVTRVNVGDFVNPGQAIIDLVQLSPIFVDFHIPEIYIKDIQLNQKIEISTSIFKDQINEGMITAIDPAIDPVTHSIYIRGQTLNTTGVLRPGLFVTVNIIIGQYDNTLFISDEALIPQQDKQFVYRVENNKAVLTEVVLGERQNNEVVVLEGLNPNDVVITAGQIKLQPGAPVHPIQSTLADSPKDKPLLPQENKDARSVAENSNSSNNTAKQPAEDGAKTESKAQSAGKLTDQDKKNTNPVIHTEQRDISIPELAQPSITVPQVNSKKKESSEGTLK
jgi:membrane fusion protein (multidrug efflux system)